MWPRKESTWEQIKKYLYIPEGKKYDETKEADLECVPVWGVRCFLLPPSSKRPPRSHQSAARPAEQSTNQKKWQKWAKRVLWNNWEKRSQSGFCSQKDRAQTPLPWRLFLLRSTKGLPRRARGLSATGSTCAHDDSAWCSQASKRTLWVFEDSCCWLASLSSLGRQISQAEQSIGLTLSSFDPEFILVVWWANQVYLKKWRACGWIALVVHLLTSVWRFLVGLEEYGMAGEVLNFGVKETDVWNLVVTWPSDLTSQSLNYLISKVEMIVSTSKGYCAQWDKVHKTKHCVVT